MLTNKIFNASALLNRLSSLSKLCFEQSMLSIKRIYAFWQTYFCLLSNVNMIASKYNLIEPQIVLTLLKT